MTRLGNGHTPWLAPGRYYPHEMLLLSWSILIGITYLVGGPQSTSLAEQLNPAVVNVWALGMTVSGVVGLIGCFWPRRFDVALELERGALVLQCGALVLFTATVFDFAGWRALTTGGILAAWAAANVHRAWTITWALKSAKRAAVERAPDDGAA